MKQLIVILFLILAVDANAQLLTTNPNFITESSSSSIIIADATKGNQGLKSFTGEVYVHIGVITNLSVAGSNTNWWRYVTSVWNTPATKFKCTNLGNDKFSFTINGNLRTFFGITNANEKILKIAVLFKDATGTKALRNTDLSDMYLTVYDNVFSVRIDTPVAQPLLVPQLEPINKKIGDTLFLNAKTSESATITFSYNDTLVNTASASTNFSTYKVINKVGNQIVRVQADNGTSIVKDSVQFLVTGDITIADLPTGVKDGINYEAGDTSVILVLYAPKKFSVNVIGDFNNWQASLPYVMKMTRDSARFWVRITGLTPGVEYAYQYVIDGSLVVADYNTEKVLDPSHDSYVPNTTYPNLKPYPKGKTTGIVSVLQTAKPAYNWKYTNFTRPDKKNLIIYEVLLRDFLAKQNFNALRDTIPYLKKLGINTIELMPVSEFEGNDSWGYNTNFYFALDKYYGTELAFKEFIDSAHAQGIAVVIDLVLNHTFGSSPLAQMYWDGTNNRPASNNPWLNPIAKHPFNVGNDLNHESAATKLLVSRVARHWLSQYKLDGFRWDLSKGFTQKNNLTDVNAWGQYDASRIAIWKTIYDTMQKVTPNSYCILEHFADNTEEKELADYGMLLWGNMNYSVNQATMGYTTEANFSTGFANSRSWTKQHLVTYMESHDEERLMYKNSNYGNVNGTYNIKDLATGLKRNEMAAAFWALTPGPKMMWQFGELGYDYSINACTDGSINNNCRLSVKPLKWDYLNVASRKQLYNIYAQFLKLRNNPSYLNDFISNKYTVTTTDVVKTMQLDGDSIKIVVVGNFDLVSQTKSISFPANGFWYSYLTNKYQVVSNGSTSITLAPGEYQVYTNKNISTQVITDVLNLGMPSLDMPLKCYPNPIQNNSILEYTLPENGNVSIKIFDMNGNDCGVLFSGYQFRGAQKMNIFKNQNMQTSGVYFLSIILNQKQKIHKILITN
jgi:1,4-alpha-glucan branching enzyme